MKSHFTSDIWNHRLQLLWILFTAFYVLVGKNFEEQWISSVMTTIGAILILCLVAHILPKKDISEERPTLILAFASSVYLSQESLKEYNDLLAAIFSAIVGACCAGLAWIEDKTISKIFKRVLFVVLFLAVISSFSQLLVTITIQKLILNNYLSQEVFVIAPHAMGIGAGMMLGFAFGLFIYTNSNQQINRKRVITSFVAFFLLGALTGYRFNNVRITYFFDDLYIGYIYSIIFVGANYIILLLGFYNLAIMKKDLDQNAFEKKYKIIFSTALSVALMNTCINKWFFLLFGKIDYSITKGLMIEIFNQGVFCLAMLYSFIAVRKLARYLHSSLRPGVPGLSINSDR